MYLNIASELYGKQIKSKLGNKLYCVHLNQLDRREYNTMPLNFILYSEYLSEEGIIFFNVNEQEEQKLFVLPWTN